MNFQRTPAGLSNEYLFLGVDAIVFVEGGLSRSEHDVYAGAFDGESQDIAFWQRWFSELMPNLKIQFRAVGAKPTLHAIALKIADGSVTHVYVAMDRDFDNLRGRIINSPKVLYTMGYSWENDVWNAVIAEDVFYALCGVCRNTTAKAMKEILAESFSAFDRDVYWATKADFLCVIHDIALLPRQSPRRVIKEATHGLPPKINKKAILLLMREAKTKRIGSINTNSRIRLEPRRDCCGHLIGAFAYSLLIYLFRRFCKRKSYPTELIDSIAMDKLFEKIRQGSFDTLRAHYQHQLTA